MVSPEQYKTTVNIDTKEFENELAAFINENAEQIAKQIRDDAKASVNVVTGNLKRSIKARKSKFDDGGWIVYCDYRIGPHAHLLEFGTEKMAAHPFLRPALDRNIAAAKAAFGVK